ncbi:hypothetical protein Tel_05255 [Candidatus Tenderia electrophaga]|uniref:DUF58 domain-containing protein n=1 Tax=Candidatus Tenderia electrophaga TaxID=1748243 RepID=A0A0S2THX9_9GAMM|nr:hypothetical protein Tel_05255 [Candidatus Tenderia electrophaga]
MGLVALCGVTALAAPLLQLIDNEAALRAGDTAGHAARLLFGALLLLSLWDLWKLKRMPAVEVTREVAHTLPVNHWSEVTLRFSHSFGRPVMVEVFDFAPAGAGLKFMPRGFTLQAGRTGEVNYRLRPAQRGPADFGQTQVLIPSPLKLWSLSRMAGAPTQVRVYPDFAAISHFKLLATDNRTSQLGIKRKQRRGEGLEFHQLRDYRDGDSLRQIDWKATVRRHKLISKEYQDERDQQLFFMLDCGRRMRAQDDDLSHFDHSLNALMLLSYVALHQGDAVGLMSFAGEQRWLVPMKSSAMVNTILNTVYDLQPTTQASDYLAAARTLVTRQRKRALVVIMTNLREEDCAELMPAIRLLRRHHLVLVANLREQMLDHTLERPVTGLEDALAYLGTCEYLQERNELQSQLRQRGVLSIDTTPVELPVRVVNGYWEIKRSGAL